jgi:hypothetical protein
MEERISDAQVMAKEIDTTVNENSNHKKLLTQSIKEIQDTIKRPNLRIIGIEENEDSQLKGPQNVFNKIIGKNLSQPKERDGHKCTRSLWYTK